MKTITNIKNCESSIFHKDDVLRLINEMKEELLTYLDEEHEFPDDGEIVEEGSANFTLSGHHGNEIELDGISVDYNKLRSNIQDGIEKFFSK